MTEAVIENNQEQIPAEQSAQIVEQTINAPSHASRVDDVLRQGGEAARKYRLTGAGRSEIIPSWNISPDGWPWRDGQIPATMLASLGHMRVPSLTG